MGSRSDQIVVLALAILLVLLAGCGHAAKQQDSFVGTWQSDTSGARLTIDAITNDPHAYTATLLSSRAAADISLVRHGNELRVDSSQLPNMARAVIDYDPSTGYLTLSKVGPGMRDLTAPAHFSRISTHTSDPFGPADSWVKVAGARGRLSSEDDSVDLLFRTHGGMVRITGTLTHPSADDLGYSEEALGRVKPPSGTAGVETVESNVMPDRPDNVEVIDEVSAHALTPGVWHYGLGAAVGTYRLTIYVKR
jgi:Fe-S cluster assembly iron-binding protein IscA